MYTFGAIGDKILRPNPQTGAWEATVVVGEPKLVEREIPARPGNANFPPRPATKIEEVRIPTVTLRFNPDTGTSYLVGLNDAERFMTLRTAQACDYLKIPELLTVIGLDVTPDGEKIPGEMLALNQLADFAAFTANRGVGGTPVTNVLTEDELPI